MCDIGGDGVGKNEKLIERVKGLPKDLTFDEAMAQLEEKIALLEKEAS